MKTMPIEDLAGLGKITEVIFGSIGKAIGTVIEPWQTRRVGYAKADVEAYAIEKKAEAERRALMITGEATASAILDVQSEKTKLRERAGQRVIAQEMTRQRNIELIVDEAAEEARRAEQDGAGARPLDDDWINAFLEYAQNVSHEDLRHIWARILASQATDGAPTVSKATLDAIRLIEPHQARMFERAVRLYLAMGQIMDIDPIDGVDVGYYSQMPEAMALEDLGLLKRMRDLEPHLDLHGGILTFWMDVAPPSSIGGSQYILWSDDRVRDDWMFKVTAIMRGEGRDHERLRNPIRVERQILTSRGFELAAIVIPEFQAYFQNQRQADESVLGDYAGAEIRAGILNEWSGKFSAMGAAVIFAEPLTRDIENEGGVAVSRRIDFDPKRIFNAANAEWEDIGQ